MCGKGHGLLRGKGELAKCWRGMAKWSTVLVVTKYLTMWG